MAHVARRQHWAATLFVGDAQVVGGRWRWSLSAKVVADAGRCRRWCSVAAVVEGDCEIDFGNLLFCGRCLVIVASEEGEVYRLSIKFSSDGGGAGKASPEREKLRFEAPGSASSVYETRDEGMVSSWTPKRRVMSRECEAKSGVYIASLIGSVWLDHPIVRYERKSVVRVADPNVVDEMGRKEVIFKDQYGLYIKKGYPGYVGNGDDRIVVRTLSGGELTIEGDGKRPPKVCTLAKAKKHDLYGGSSYSVYVITSRVEIKKRKETVVPMAGEYYRELTKLPVRIRYPLSRIDDLFDQLQGATWFSKLDLRLGYHQWKVRGEDVCKMAFCTRDVHLEFIGMPFVLTNVPISDEGTSVIVCIGDMLIYRDRRWSSWNTYEMYSRFYARSVERGERKTTASGALRRKLCEALMLTSPEDVESMTV
ncbi:hypothetical protein OSB04_003786 [Centaurea solstitialis]|uniref:RNA-directed DNA polymerase-like n=1 Tax=Centaurea solstitialis TaxID=347529 RepID=A0AA38U793_9ASTR|nr:hypothetical protein OSB04_003786 [Centaurea solstitialis]